MRSTNRLLPLFILAAAAPLALAACSMGPRGASDSRAIEISRSRDRMMTCQDQITTLAAVKIVWAAEHPDAGRAPTWDDLVLAEDDWRMGYLFHELECPTGHAYRINAPGRLPDCLSGYPGHSRAPVGTLIGPVDQDRDPGVPVAAGRPG